MRLLFVSEATGWTGGAGQILMSAVELRRRGHEVAVACPAAVENGSSSLRARLAAADVPVHALEIRREIDLTAANRLRRLARDWAADIIHAHHPQAHAVALAALHLAAGPPLVVTRRVIFPVRSNPLSLYKYRSRRVSRYVAVCEAVARELESAGVARERIRVVPSAVEMERFEAARRARAQVRDGRPPIVMMVGNFSPIKGHEVLLRAAKIVIRERPDVRFRLVGRRTEALAGVVRAMGLARHVDLLGERWDISELLAQSHLFAMPSLQEGIGTALIEAQAAMVPVVASAVGGLPEVVTGGSTGLLVAPGDHESLAGGLLRLLRDPASAAEMALRGYERVRELFGRERAVDRLEAVYREVAA